MDPINEIQFEFPPFIRIYKSGRVERLLGTHEFAPASVDAVTGVSSKDILISPETGVSARLYLPKVTDNEPNKKFPILVYFHGGGFCFGGAFTPYYHNYLTSLVAKANVVAVSVEYRLAPEHPVPAAYDDSWRALQWVASHAERGPEGWLSDRADFGRVFVGGDSAGANIAHHMAMRAGDDGLECRVSIQGSVLIHPYFWGTERLESETMDVEMSKKCESIWMVACPLTMGFEDPRINPLAKDAPCLSSLACRRVLVCVPEKGVLRDIGRAYCRCLRRSGWEGEVETLVMEDEGHGFHLERPSCEKALAQERAISSFLNLN